MLEIFRLNHVECQLGVIRSELPEFRVQGVTTLGERTPGETAAKPFLPVCTCGTYTAIVVRYLSLQIGLGPTVLLMSFTELGRNEPEGDLSPIQIFLQRGQLGVNAGQLFQRWCDTILIHRLQLIRLNLTGFGFGGGASANCHFLPNQIQLRVDRRDGFLQPTDPLHVRIHDGADIRDGILTVLKQLHSLTLEIFDAPARGFDSRLDSIDFLLIINLSIRRKDLQIGANNSIHGVRRELRIPIGQADKKKTCAPGSRNL